MTMNKTNYKQYDTRWAKLLYPKKPWYIKNCGCGEVAICNSIIEMAKYASQTPKTIQPYCKQYAAPNGDGTYHSGIPAMMKHYGMTEVKEHATMKPLWDELAKGNRVAIYLMGKREAGSKKVRWTSSGHFVCSTGYKYENGKHYVYVKDSNSTSTNRNGWITYEENMKYAVLKVWSGKLATAPEKKAYTGEYPNTTVKYTVSVDRGKDIEAKAREYAWPAGTASSKYAYSTGSAKESYKAALKKYMGKSAKVSQTDCGYFASTCVRASGVSSDFLCLPGSYKNAYPSLPSSMSIVHQGAMGSFTLKAGDIIRYKKTSSQHTVVYIGGGQIAHASRSHAFPRVASNKPWTNSNVKTSTLQVLRAKPGTKEETRNYLKKGDRGEEVKKLQKYINWFFGKDVLTVDGIWGDNTQKYCVDMQKALGFTDADGLVGPKTVEAMKNYKK